MKLQFLGTGAADWVVPQSEVANPIDFRRFSSALIDDTLLIDPGPHIFDFAEQNGTPHMFDNVRYCIVTHSHADHLCPETVEKLRELSGCHFYGSYGVRQKLALNSSLFQKGDNPFQEVHYETRYSLGNYSIIPLRSNHTTENPQETTLNYIIENEKGKRMFYGLDSAWIPVQSWIYMRNMPMQVMVLELTIGDVAGDFRVFEHTSIPMLKIMLETMRSNHYCAENARIFVSHMARGLHGTHAELCRQLAPLDVIPAYDGLTLEIE